MWSQTTLRLLKLSTSEDVEVTLVRDSQNINPLKYFCLTYYTSRYRVQSECWLASLAKIDKKTSTRVNHAGMEVLCVLTVIMTTANSRYFVARNILVVYCSVCIARNVLNFCGHGSVRIT